MTDRRVKRTRELLQRALIDLISERGYETITIQDVVDRAGVGRTTFYLHFRSKEDLFVSCQDIVAAQFQFGTVWRLGREELLAPDAPPGVIAAYRHYQDARAILFPIFHGKDSALILRRFRDWSAQEIEASLREAFDEAQSRVPFPLLASFLAGAQLALLQWWTEKHQPYSADVLAQTFHRFQRAAICDALGINPAS